MKVNSEINEINFLDEIDGLEEEYIKKFGVKPLNVSNWNSSYEFKSDLVELIEINVPFNQLDYIFSYSESDDIKESIFDKLGFTDKAILFTHSGSASIINTVNLLKYKGITKIVVLCPAYFTLFHACKAFNIELVSVYLHRDDDGFYFDNNELVELSSSDTAYWITNPVYCTSVYYTSEQIKFFRNILENNMVVFDESLSILGKEIGRIIGDHPNFIGIYSPHKTICMNGRKFSCTISNKEEQSILDAWSDVFCGCLGVSNDIAISHFLSQNYDIYSSAFHKKIDIQFSKIIEICKIHNVSYDQLANGYLISLYFPNIPAEKGLEIPFAKDVMFNTGIRYISGIRNHFSEEYGFCFRINLSALKSTDYYFLERAIIYLKHL